MEKESELKLRIRGRGGKKDDSDPGRVVRAIGCFSGDGRDDLLGRQDSTGMREASIPKKKSLFFPKKVLY